MSSLVISCASTQEMSAEEERMSGMNETPVAAASTTTEVAAPLENPPQETKEAAPSLMSDPGISEAAPTPTNTLETISEKPATEPTLVRPEEKAAASEATASETESLPLSGAMTQVEEKVNAPQPELVNPTASSLDTSSLSATPESTEGPTLVVPTLDTPKVAKRTKRTKKMGSSIPEVTKAPVKTPAVAAQEVDTQPAKNVVANQVAVTEVDGVKLNRFYFLRPGDHTEKVSELLYGNRSMADKLVKWNGGVQNWVPGNRIVYPSPVNKNDTQFTSFYEEGRVAFKEYRVQKGENLKTLAARFYGDVRCWSELAHVNSLPLASATVSEGVVLKFAPEKLVATTVQAKAEVPSNEVKDDEEDAFAAADKAAEKAQPNLKKEKTLASANIGAFIMNNLFLIVTVTLVLGLIVFMVKSRDKDPMEF